MELHRLHVFCALRPHSDAVAQWQGAGGWWGGPGTRAELYDPATGTWATTGSLVHARGGHTATLLPNGKVLVAGGQDGATAVTLSSAELYDPATGTWTLTGSLNIARTSHTATLLPNGKVLVAGGVDDDDGINTVNLPVTAELYDPATGKWTLTSALHDSRFGHSATLLPNGKVLVAGGWNEQTSENIFLTSAEVYDPGTGRWSSTGSLQQGRWLHTATLLSNGKVLVAGGFQLNSFQAIATAELYDPGTGTWAATGSLVHVRGGHTATLLPDGHVLVAGGSLSGSGGCCGPANSVATAELYDPPVVPTPTPTLVPPTPTPTRGHGTPTPTCVCGPPPTPSDN
jgi:N-acetylneuraminic acid mutarotase